MVFEPNFTKVVSSVRKNIGITQSVVELKLPTNENTVSNIYSVGARSTIITKEAVGREVSFSGVVDIQAVYESDGVVSAIDYSAEFKDKYLTDEDMIGELIVSSNVVDVNSSIVSGGIRAVVVVETTIDLIESNDRNVLTSVDGDGVHIATKDITYSTYVGRAYEKFEVSDEFQIKNATKILMVTPCVTITKVEPKENFVSVIGRVNTDVCYQNGDGVCNIATQEFVSEFSWEVALAGIDEDSSVQSVSSVMFNDIKVTTMIEDGVSAVNLLLPVVYEGYVFNENKIDVVDDLYSENNYLSVTSENINTLDGEGSIFFKDNISGSVSISETSPFIDDVIGACTNNIVLASSRVGDNILSVEGVASVSVIYFTKETNSLTSVQVEMPFSIEQKVDGDNASVVSLCLSNVLARSKRGKEIEVSAELNVFVDMYSEEYLTLISGVGVGDEKIEDDCSLYIYIVKPNQTLWDVAKDMNVSQEDILEQNPELELPVKPGDKLVIYKQNVASM